MRVEGHIREYTEFKRNYIDALSRNEQALHRANRRLEEIEESVSRVSIRVAAIVGTGSAIVTLVSLWVNFWRH